MWLTAAPTGDVMVTPTSDDTSAVTVTGALTFSTMTWNMARTVTVTASTEGTVTTATLTHGVTGDDRITDGGEVTVTINRAPVFGMAMVADQTYTAGMAIPPLTLPEATSGNGMLAYDLTGAIPDGLAFDADARTLTGTPTGAASAVTLTYTATDSDTDTADRDEATRTFAVTVVEPAAPRVRLNPTAITVVEGGTATYRVWLTAAPTGDVMGTERIHAYLLIVRLIYC